MARARSVVVALVALLVVGACASAPDDVCESIAACEAGGDTEQVQACQDEADLSERVAGATGCGASFERYFACAQASFTCRGNVASFPGCDDERKALDDCFASGAAGNACGELATRTAACGPAVAPEACTATRECAARCYLTAVADPCVPTPRELVDSAACAQRCPR